MKKKLIFIVFIYTIIMVIIGQLIISHINKTVLENSANSEYSENISVELNEVKQLIASGEDKAAIEKCDEIISLSGDGNADNRALLLMWIFIAVNIIAISIILTVIYFRILKPFEAMKEYADEIAKGNMDVSLKMDRGNYFGDFTWTFENMRKEIIKSRAAEKTAIENNKTIIATLSHDIKTPMASIRAYAEAFEANMDTTPEKRQKYLSVMMEKCDEVSRLTNDLFIHSISEMKKLDVNQESLDIYSFVDTEVRGLFVDDEEAEILLPDMPETEADEGFTGILIKADRKRLLQIIENLKSNAEKYAKTKVQIELDTADGIKLHFRDFGAGIPDAEIPFITGKFYRGKNVGDENGSGLGLYIVSELMEKMGGKVSFINKSPGLDVVMEFAGAEVDR